MTTPTPTPAPTPADVLHGSIAVEELLSRLATSPDRLAEAVAGATDEALDRTPGEDEWSARTVLAHLRDDELMVMRVRAARILVEDRPDLPPFDEQAWAAARWTGADGRDQLVEGFRLQRAATMGVLEQVGDEDWRRVGTQPEIGSFDLHWWMQHVLEHDDIHIAQVRAALGR